MEDISVPDKNSECGGVEVKLDVLEDTSLLQTNSGFDLQLTDIGQPSACCSQQL